MKPSKLKQHFKFCHGELVEKSVDYFRRKAEHLKNRRLDSGKMWPRQNKALLEVSYRIAFRTAQSKKSHAIGEELIKPCLIEATTLVLGKEKAKKLEEISLSNDTVKKRISEMSQDILLQVVEEIRSSPIFSLPLDESTDVSSGAGAAVVPHGLTARVLCCSNCLFKLFLFFEIIKKVCMF